MLELLVVKIIESVEISCGKVKAFFEGYGHIYLGKSHFCDFFALAFTDLVFPKLDLIEKIRAIFDN